MHKVPTVTLNDGNTIPQLGFGVFLVPFDTAERVVSDALEVGYRHIDTAYIYKNEAAVGRAIAKSGIPRSELFITTKLWAQSHGRTEPHQAIDASLERLGLDYVDLYLIHWPMPAQGQALDTWLAFEEIAKAGKARSIGVSNFHPDHLEPLLAKGSTVPAVDQVELHPIFQQRKLREFLTGHNIQVEAWGPLGQGKYNLNDYPVLTDLAAKYGKLVQQIVIRWHLQEGNVVFPKSSNKDRMRQNFEVFDFELSPSDMAQIAALDEDRRVSSGPDDERWTQVSKDLGKL